eukprot:scaffold369_cov177-Ochromonas_danica.AAC.10
MSSQPNLQDQVNPNHHATTASDLSRVKDPSSLYKPISSSLSLQMLVYFSQHYTPLFFIVNICLFAFKGESAN